MNWAIPRWMPGGSGLPQSPFSAAALSTARCLGWLPMSARRNSSGSLPAARADKAFHVHAVLVGIDAAPGADRHMGVAHDVFDEQVGHGVAELRIAGLLPKPLQLTPVSAVDDARRVQRGVDGLAADAHVQPHEVAVRIETGGATALRDRPEEVVRLVLLPAPNQLDRHARKLLGDRHRLVHVILRAAAPTEAAAEVGPVDLAFGERYAGGLR